MLLSGTATAIAPQTNDQPKQQTSLQRSNYITICHLKY